jgi:hypothetical protein
MSQSSRKHMPASDDHRGQEIFEVTPIVFGGSPTDPANKVWLTRDQHIKAVVHWNKVLRQIREGTKEK